MSITKPSTPQTLEIPVTGPGNADCLLIFSGTVEVSFKGTSGEWRRGT